MVPLNQDYLYSYCSKPIQKITTASKSDFEGTFRRDFLLHNMFSEPQTYVTNANSIDGGSNIVHRPISPRHAIMHCSTILYTATIQPLYSHYTATILYSHYTATIQPDEVMSEADSVPRLGRGRKPTQARKHGGPGLPEDFCVCAAAAMSRLSPPASPERARCMANRASMRASRRLPTPQG